jgi:hypothetical protein
VVQLEHLVQVELDLVQFQHRLIIEY